MWELNYFKSQMFPIHGSFLTSRPPLLSFFFYNVTSAEFILNKTFPAS